MHKRKRRKRVLRAAALALFALCLRGRQALATALPLGLTALMAPAWFVLLRSHSIQHGWFTWRALGVTLFAGLAFLSYACSPRAGLRRLRRLRGLLLVQLFENIEY